MQNAFREVLDALRGQTLLAGVSAASDRQVSALRRAVELAELRYSQGDIAYIELLDVRRGLLHAEMAGIGARRDALLNAVDLVLALGAGPGPRSGPAAAGS